MPSRRRLVACCLVAWAGCRAGTSQHGGGDLGALSGDLGAASADLGAASADLAPAPLPTGRFRVGMWCGPPNAQLTKARFDEIKAAGFTTASASCDGTTSNVASNTKMLALAQDAGLDVIVSDDRIGAALAGNNVAANLDGVVHDYASAPALAGYFLGDEPSASQFPSYAATTAGLATRDAAHFVYTNLLPDYASSGQLGAASYDDYVRGFLATVKPLVFSYDYYPFLSDGSEAATFFATMAVVRTHAVATGIPFWQFTQAISFTGHRTTNAAEKLWVGTETLAYGGVGVSYFTYWTPPQTTESFGSALIDANGAETAQYAEAKAVNARLAAFGRYLVAAKSTAVFQNGALSAGQTPRVPGAPVYLPSAAPITVGRFAVGNDEYAFLVNRSYAATTDSDVYFSAAASKLEMLDVASGAFVAASASGSDAKGTRVHVSLAPGDAALFHLVGPVAAGAPGAEAFMGVARSNAGTLDVVDAAFGTATVRAAGFNDCPEGYTFAGRLFDPNGFWLCARNDLAARTFYVGNVVADAGTMYAVHAGAATSMGAASWNMCPGGSTLLGRRFDSNGYWICL